MKRRRRRQRKLLRKRRRGRPTGWPRRLPRYKLRVIYNGRVRGASPRNGYLRFQSRKGEQRIRWSPRRGRWTLRGRRRRWHGVPSATFRLEMLFSGKRTWRRLVPRKKGLSVRYHLRNVGLRLRRGRFGLRRRTRSFRGRGRRGRRTRRIIRRRRRLIRRLRRRRRRQRNRQRRRQQKINRKRRRLRRRRRRSRRRRRRRRRLSRRTRRLRRRRQRSVMRVYYHRAWRSVIRKGHRLIISLRREQPFIRVTFGQIKIRRPHRGWRRLRRPNKRISIWTGKWHRVTVNRRKQFVYKSHGRQTQLLFTKGIVRKRIRRTWISLKPRRRRVSWRRRERRRKIRIRRRRRRQRRRIRRRRRRQRRRRRRRYRRIRRRRRKRRKHRGWYRRRRKIFGRPKRPSLIRFYYQGRWFEGYRLRGRLRAKYKNHWRQIRCRGSILSIRYKRKWHRLNKAAQVRFRGQWRPIRREGRQLIVYKQGKRKQIKIYPNGNVVVLVPSHYESVREKPTPKPVRKPRPRRPYGIGRRSRQRWRKRLRRRRRRRRRRYIRRLRGSILRFRLRGRWRGIVKWRGEYRMLYRERWITFRQVRGSYFIATYRGKRQTIRRIKRRFKIRLGFKQWKYITLHRRRLMVKVSGRYRLIRLNRGRLRIRYGRRWNVLSSKPRGRQGRRRWRRRRRRRRRRRLRRRRRRYRRRMRRRRQRNVLLFYYGKKWIPVYRWLSYLRARYRGSWRRVRFDHGKIGFKYGRRYSWLSNRPIKLRFGRRLRSVRFYRGKYRIRFGGKLRKFRVTSGRLRLLVGKTWKRPITRRYINRRRRRRLRRRLRRRKRRRRRRIRRRRRNRLRRRSRVMLVSYRRRNKSIYKKGWQLFMRYRRKLRRVRLRNGFIAFRFQRKWHAIKRRPLVLFSGRWRRLTRHSGRIQIKIGRRKYRPFKLRLSRFYYLKGRTWRRVIPRKRYGQRRRRLRRRKSRLYMRKLRRIRRYRRRRLRRMRRIRRFRRQTSPLKIRYHKKTRKIYRWKGWWTVRLGGRRRKLRLRNDKFLYFFRRAWRRVQNKKFELYAFVNGWRRIEPRRRGFFIRFRNNYRLFRLGKTSPHYQKNRKWFGIKRRRLPRRRVPWRRWRRPGWLRGRRHGVMRLYAFRRWRTVFRKRGGIVYFRVGKYTYRLSRIIRGVIKYLRKGKWYRIPTKRLRIRVKGRYRLVRRVRKTLRVLYQRKYCPIRFPYGKLRFYFKRRWRRPSTRGERRRRRRQKRRRFNRYWRRLNRRRRRRRRGKYIGRKVKMLLRYGRRFRLVRRKGHRLTFTVGRNTYKLGISNGRIYTGRRHMRRLKRLVRRLKMYFLGRWHWIYPRKGLLYVYYKKKGRPVRLRQGKPQIFIRKRWIEFGRRKVPVVMRLRFNGWRPVVKLGGVWKIYYSGSYRRIKLRGNQFGILINGRWKYVSTRGTLQIRRRKIWRWVRNCCNRLRAVLRGKLRRIRLRNGQALMRQGRIWKHVPAKYKGAFHLGKLRDQPSAENSAKPLDQPSESNPIDPSTYTDAPAKALVYDSPPTAADQEEPPESITNEMSKESGATMDSDDYL